MKLKLGNIGLAAAGLGVAAGLGGAIGNKFRTCSQCNKAYPYSFSSSHCKQCTSKILQKIPKTRHGDVIFDDVSFETEKKRKCTLCDDPNCKFDPDYKEDKAF